MIDNKFRGKRAEISVYDDTWIHGDDGAELIVPSPNFEYKQTSLSDIINNIIK